MIKEVKGKRIEIKILSAEDRIEIEQIKELFIEYTKSLAINLDFQNIRSELETLPGKYVKPDGLLILALVDGQTAGCIALRKLEEKICEMKRLYVRDEFRGYGIGSSLISFLVNEAKRMNYDFMRLDTLDTMKAAQNLYVSYGFYDIEPYTFNPINGARFMELNLLSNKKK